MVAVASAGVEQGLIAIRCLLNVELAHKRYVRVHGRRGPANGGNTGAGVRARRVRGTAALGVAVAMLTSAAVWLLPPGDAAAAGPRGQASVLAAIPARYLTWYKKGARTCQGLSWEVLAGIGRMESNNGRSNARGVHRGRNRKGAEGPMQFEPATFAEYAVRADLAHKLTPYDPEDAIFTAARMLCADGARGGSPKGLRGAIFAYNHAHWYVRDVLAIAARYTAAARRAGRRRARGHRLRRHLTGLGGT